MPLNDLLDKPVPLMSDGVVAIRATTEGDFDGLVAGRDELSCRFLGLGVDAPWPSACILIDDRLAGWVDYRHEEDQRWLSRDEVDLGYQLFPEFRGRGLATRAVQLLTHHLAMRTTWSMASLLIDPGDEASLALAKRTGFSEADRVGDQRYFRRPVPPVIYTDGVVTIRRQRIDDLEMHLEAIDDLQIDWLWLPGHRQEWESKSRDERRAYQLAHLERSHLSFGYGPEWRFSVDGAGVNYIAYVDCNLANDDVPHGEANISYVAHPAFRSRGYVARSVRLILRFLRDHTGAREAHIVIDAENEPSLRVARAVGAAELERSIDANGRTMIRHVLRIRD
jgi:RimJ/RimL family protein N-acetyltransferase